MAKRNKRREPAQPKTPGESKVKSQATPQDISQEESEAEDIDASLDEPEDLDDSKEGSEEALPQEAIEPVPQEEEKKQAEQSRAEQSLPSSPVVSVPPQETQEPVMDAHTKRAPAMLSSAQFPLEGSEPPPPPPSPSKPLVVGETPVERPQRQKFKGNELGEAKYKVRAIKNPTPRNSEICLEDGRVYVAQFKHDGGQYPVALVPQVVFVHMKKLFSSNGNYDFQV